MMVLMLEKDSCFFKNLTRPRLLFKKCICDASFVFFLNQKEQKGSREKISVQLYELRLDMVKLCQVESEQNWQVQTKLTIIQ